METRTDNSARRSQPPAGPHTRRARGRRFARIAFAFVILTVFVGLILAVPATAAPGDFTISGRGYGHAMGMSQWGAWAGAREGATYEQIIAFYYPGTTLGTVANQEIKVRLTPVSDSNSAYYRIRLKPTVTAATLVMKASSGETTRSLAVGETVETRYSAGKVQVVGVTGTFDWVEVRPATTSGRVAVTLLATSSSDPASTSNQREYWGKLQVTPSSSYSSLLLYNFVLLERYLRSIREIDPGWANSGLPAQYAPECVKAQTVASRSYALARLTSRAYLWDNTNDQVYGGYTRELTGLIAAVEATAGKVPMSGGKPIYGYVSTHSGGYTSDSAWSTTASYLVAKPDPWSLKAPVPPWTTPPGWPWTKTFTPAGITSALGLGVGTVTAIEVIERDTTDSDSHATTLRVTGTTGSKTIAATTFRSRLSLRSTLILSITKEGGSTPSTTRYEESNPKIAYTGTWLDFTTSGASGGVYKYADSAASATIAFTGTRLDWIATKGTTQGKARVSLDGGDPVTVDLYSPSTLRQQKAWSTGTIADGAHTVTITWLGQRSVSSGGTRVNLDAVDIVGTLDQPAPPPAPSYTRMEETSTAISYSGTWLSFPASGASGGAYKYADSAASATISFQGTRLDWIATRGYTQGKALLSLDGKPGVEVNLYSPTTLRQQTVWSSGELSAGTHTLRISWTGKTGASGGGTRVNVDAFDIYGSLSQMP